MIGILTEKPSAKRNFAKALGGFSGVFDGEEYVIASARGHLYQFVEPKLQVDASKQEQYSSWNLDNLPWDEKDFKWRYEKGKDVTKTLNEIKEALKDCDEIVIGTDDDPSGEGELLAWEILASLKLKPKKWSRMYFVDESKTQIVKAFKNRVTIPSMMQDKDFIKAFYRARWDFLSMQFTRIASKVNDKDLLLRNGRLKSAMCVMIGNQLELVKNYKKIPFYENRFKDENEVTYKSEKEPKYEKKADVPNIYTDSNVILDKKEDKFQAPPKLLDLASLSARLATKGYSPEEVLETYQKMYEDQIVSYPRTEDKNITLEQFNELLPLADDIARVVGVKSSELTYRKPRKTHVKDKGSHGANRPGTNVPKSLKDLTKYGPSAEYIYIFLARNYLAMLCDDYRYERQTGHLEKYPDFKGSCNVPKSYGWKRIYDDGNKTDVSKGLGTVAKPFIYEGFPPKPKNPTMKWLMKELEKRDIGTGATRTSTFAEISKDSYKGTLIKNNKGSIKFTECGSTNYLLLKDTNIGSLEVTKRLMDEMKEVEAGNKNPEVCLHDLQRMVKEDLDTMTANAKTNGIFKENQKSTFEQVDRCTGMWLKPGTKRKREVSFKREWGGHYFTDIECEKLLDGEIVSFSAKSSRGKDYTCEGALAEQTYNGNKFVGFKPDFGKKTKRK